MSIYLSHQLASMVKPKFINAKMWSAVSYDISAMIESSEYELWFRLVVGFTFTDIIIGSLNVSVVAIGRRLNVFAFFLRCSTSLSSHYTYSARDNSKEGDQRQHNDEQRPESGQTAQEWLVGPLLAPQMKKRKQFVWHFVDQKQLTFRTVLGRTLIPTVPTNWKVIRNYITGL